MKRTLKIVIIIIVLSILSILGKNSYDNNQERNQMIIDMNDPTKWITIQGGATIMESTYEISDHTDSSEFGRDNDWYRMNNTRVTTVYIPIITYQYNVGGIDYIGSIVSPDGRDSFNSLSEVDAYLSLYSPKNKVDVIYQIANPNNAYLKKGNHKKFTVIASITVFLAVIISLLIWTKI
jgi:hypothetical protein